MPNDSASLRGAARWVRRLPERVQHRSRRAEARRRLAALGTADGLLFVCHGNICRSPFAEAVAQRLAGAGPRIASAGVHGPDRAATGDAIAVARAKGFDLSGHVSRLATTEEVLAARCVVVMEPGQRTALAARTGRPVADILVLGDLDPEPITHRSIPDPIGQTRGAYEACYARIERCVGALLDAALPAGSRRAPITHIAQPLAEEWADPPPDDATALIARSRAIGWKAALAEVGDRWPYFTKRVRDFGVANWHLVVPHARTTQALDVGCGFGALMLGLSRYFAAAAGVELLPRRLAWSGIRTREDGEGRTWVVKATGQVLPFAARHFALVTLNGVLEWAALHQDGQPDALQIQLLREARRVLAPDGHLTVAIENRYALESLLGFYDTHTGLPFVTFVPRPVADWFTRWRRHQPYRTWLYGRRGYERLFRAAGFTGVRVLDLSPSYNSYQYVIDPNDAASYRFLARLGLLTGFYGPATRLRATLTRVLPAVLGRVSYAYLVVAGSDATTVLDDAHPLWASAGLAATGRVHRFACRSDAVASLAIVEHDGQAVRRIVEVGVGGPVSSEPAALPDALRAMLPQAWVVEDGVALEGGTAVRIFTPAP